MTWRNVLIAAGVAVAVAVGALAAGTKGALAATTALSIAAMATAGLTTAHARRPQEAHETPAPDPLAPFVTYRKIEASLAWAGTSGTHYDRVVRPLLARLLAERLLDRHGVDLAARPDLARDLAGADLWPYFDPAAATTGPGVGAATMRRLVQRLEEI